MIGWFKKHAPVRRKFTLLIGINLLLAGSVAATVAVTAGPGLALWVALSAALASSAVLAGARVLICNPYVETVERMEALAAGDVETPFAYPDHRDCVGRMTRAMEVFRANAIDLRDRGQVTGDVIGAVRTALEALAAGRFQHRIGTLPQGYETLRESFNATLGELAELMEQVRGSASAVHSGASEINSASNDLAQRTERQAASLAETAAAMGEVTQAVGETARAAGSAAGAVGTVNAEALEGGRVVQSAVSAMAAIEKSASEIGQIINVIDGIAFQTNLLALNAGVEAARAGDAGRGFAVVANEVRALAQRCADSAKDIKRLIEASNAQVSGGVKLVGETGAILTRMVGKIGDVTNLVSQISSSAEEQAKRIQQINGSVGQMDLMTQQNAAMVEQTNAAARSLASEADSLAALMARFGDSAPATTYARAAAPAPAPRAAAPRLQTQGNAALDEDWAEF